MSETVQIWTHSNMNDFQHKNVCKTIDTNTRMCYYIDNTRTCYTTTKQEDKTMMKYYHVITERNDEYISAIATVENIESEANTK